MLLKISTPGLRTGALAGISVSNRYVACESNGLTIQQRADLIIF
jgi:hypothetical protein